MSPPAAGPPAAGPPPAGAWGPRLGRGLGLALAFGLAVAVRWQGLAVTSALGDAMGPWWVGARGPLTTTPHAPPYGWMLALPHALLLAGADSLWSAVAGLHLLHALVAPVVGLATARLAGRTAPGLVAAAARALAPGLLDTCWSGAEAYLAPVGIGLLVLAPTLGRWGPWLAALALPWATMNHPYALLVGAPLAALLPWRPAPAALGLLLLGPHLVHLAAASATGEAAAGATGTATALDAWVRTAGPGALVVGAGALAGLRAPGPRRVVAAGLAGLGLLIVAGLWVGPLRDHHLRLAAVPLVAGLAGVPGRWVWALLLGLRLPPDPVQRPAQGLRPGTLGLLHHTSRALDAVPGPLQVLAATPRGAPVVEPGGVVLDRWLRGGALGTGGTVALVLTVGRGNEDELPEGILRIDGRDGWVLATGTEAAVRDATATLCARAPGLRAQTAWDGWVVAVPGQPAAALEAAWGCGPPPPAPQGIDGPRAHP